MAGKRIEVAELVVTTTDGDTLKLFGQKTKKAAKEVDNLGKASQSTDRRIKGVTQQSSNATKNFSKQAQTMQGGIVAVYATIAAQVFAVSAAYQFLKSSMETRNLIEGQKAFGAVTGVAYKTLTKDLQDATQGMLDFKAAASSLAIGTASGLTASQMTGLGDAAKNASLALGRDLTDSFNRLVRGVTKAEPELLDELGIVLRLENATRDYALAVGKARDDLNAYERTQAVLNDVMEQAERKFGRITELMDPKAFALGQLTKEIDDLVLGFQEMLVNGLLPFIGFFRDNAAALVAAIGLFLTPILRSILPDLDKAVAKSTKAQDKALSKMSDNWKAAGQEIRTSWEGMKTLTKDDEIETAGALDKMGVKGTGDKIKDAKGKDTGLNTLSKRQIAAYKRAIREKKGIYMKMTKEEQVIFKKHLARSEAMFRKSKQVEISIAKRTQMIKDGIVKAGVAVVQAAETAKLQIIKVSAAAMNTVMTVAGYMGMIAMVLAGLKAIWDWFAKGDEAAQKMAEATKKVQDRLVSINTEIQRMGQVRRDVGLLGLVDGISQSGKALQSLDIKATISEYHAELKKSGLTAEKFAKTDLGKEFLKSARSIEMVAPGMKGFAASMAEGSFYTDKLMENGKPETWANVANEISNGAMALERFGENAKSVNKQIEQTIGKQAKLPFESLIKPLTAAINGYKDAFNLIEERLEEMRQRKTSGSSLGAFDTDMYDTVFLDDGMGKEIATTMPKNDVIAQNVKSMRASVTADFGGRDGKLNAQEMRQFAESAGLSTGEGWFDGPAADFDSSTIMRDLLMMGNNAKKIQDYFSLTNDELDILEKNIAESELKSKQMAQENARNIVLAGKMEQIQSDLLELEENKIAAARQLATFGVGSGKALAFAKAQYKVTQLDEKATQKKLDHDTAIANFDLERRKMIDQILLKEGNTLELKELQGKTVAELTALGGKDLENQARVLSNAEKAKANTFEEKELANDLLENGKEQLIIDNAGLTIQYSKLAGLEEELRLKNALNAIDRGLKTSTAFGWAGAREKYAAKGNKIAARQAINANNRSTTLGNLTTRAGKNVTEGMSLKDILGEAGQDHDQYKEIVKLYGELNKLKEEDKDLTAENTQHVQSQTQAIKDGIMAQNEVLNFKREVAFTLNPAEKIFQEEVIKHLDKFGTITEENKQLLAEQAIEQANLNIEIELMSGVAQTLENGFVSMFQAMVDGSKSFKESFQDLAVSVLQDLAAMFAKAAALKFLMAMFPGFEGTMTAVQSIPGMGGRYGGIMSPSGKSFKYGGYATGPQSGYQATLHGNEAVVPLGNDRSIPVKMLGNQGGGNVVNVTVNMSGNGQSQSSVTGTGGQALGRQIGSLVQQHLQQQMQPGGLLNPQGSQGRNR